MDTHDHMSPIVVSTSSLAIDELIASFEENVTFRNTLKEADVLLVPTDLRPQYDSPVFPITTRTVFKRLQEGLGESLMVEAAVLDNDYFEYEYRSEQIILPVLFVAQHVLVPLVVDLIVLYIHDILASRGNTNLDITVQSEFHFKDASGKQLSLKYDGPADVYERTLSQHIPNLALTAEQEDATSNDSS